MQRFASRLPGQAHFLTAKDCLEAFEFFDQDGTGLMEYPEMQGAFNRMLDPAKVDISAYEGQSFTPAVFRTTAEWCHRNFPQYNVAGNLMKFIKENREKADDDDADITDKELKKLFNTYDRDRSDQMSIQELIGVWKYLRLPFNLIMDARAMDGSVSFEEFCGIIRDINAAHPELDVDEKINTFVAGLGAGPPDINTAPDQANDSAGAVGDEDPPKKKAFLVGINYVGTSCELGGCINDANNQKAALMENFGFGEEDIRMLTDDTDDKPTAENIRAGLEWLIEGADAGDYLFFAYSGHGSQLPCQDATEPDGKNEILCPLDLQDDWYANSIKDDYLYDLFYKRVPDGVRCLCVYDCCHSGTMADLSCTRTFNPPWEESDVKDRYLEPPEEMAAEVEAFAAAAKESGITQRDMAFPDDGSKDLIWTISGCQDNQTSADATIDGQRQGACTWALLSSLKTGGQGPWKYQYESLLGEMRKKLRTGGYAQVPGMATTEDELFQRFYLANRP